MMMPVFRWNADSVHLYRTKWNVPKQCKIYIWCVSKRNAGSRCRLLPFLTWYIHPNSLTPWLPKMMNPIWVAVADGMPTIRRHIEQKFVLTGNGKSWIFQRLGLEEKKQFRWWLCSACNTGCGSTLWGTSSLFDVFLILTGNSHSL